MDDCKYEKDIIELKLLVPQLQVSVKDLVTILQGSNSNGFVSKLKGIATQVKIQWWFIAGISFVILGAAFWVIRASVS